MNFKVTKILIWVLSWATLSLIIVYSPIGSPELYIPNKYIIQNQSVNFSSGITNASSVRRIQQYEDPDFAIPTYTPAPKTYTLNVSAGTSKTISQTNYGVTLPANNRTVSNQSSGGGSSGGGFTFMGSHSTAAQQTSVPQSTSISSLSTDLAMSADPGTTRQLATSGALDGGTDPGGDPTGPPIPVGNGFWFLLLLAVGYAGWKMKIWKE